MSEGRKRSRGNGERETITVSLPPEIVERLAAFCREMKVSPDRVVERALADYFREGDVSH
jgi:predicted transcriptional regulator